jgi:hypothetical protein
VRCNSQVEIRRKNQQPTPDSDAPGKREWTLEEIVRQYADARREAARVGFTQGVQDALE